MPLADVKSARGFAFMLKRTKQKPQIKTSAVKFTFINIIN